MKSTRKNRFLKLSGVLGILGSAALFIQGLEAQPKQAAAKPAQAAPAVSAPGMNADPKSEAFRSWAADAFPWGEGNVTAEDVPGVKIRGYRLLKISKEYKADNRVNDMTFVAVENMGTVAIIGDLFVNEARVGTASPVRSAMDLGPITEQLKKFLRGRFNIDLDPANDRPALKGIKLFVQTGYGPYEIGGYVTADDGALVLLGRIWDRKRSIPDQRKEMIKLAGVPVSGPADAKVTVIEYSDMQCGFCKKRSLDWEPLLKKLEGQLKIKRYFKSFPLTEAHPWAFRSSSAGRCFFDKDPKLFALWKSNVYSRQDQLTTQGVDQFALDFAAANDISEAEFQSCYLKDKMNARILGELSEGFAVRVRATPTYFIDGVQISWFTDGLMEEYLRKTYLK